MNTIPLGMSRIKNTFTLIHLSGWLVLFLVLGWVLRGEGHADWLSKAGILIALFSVLFYSHFLLLTYFLYRRKYIVYVLGLLVLLRVSPLSFLWAYGVERRNWPLLGEQNVSFLVIGLVCIFLSWIAKATQNRFLRSLQEERTQNQAIRAELSYLKAQINPHFLFNTLNNIHTLSYKNSPLAPDAIRRLSSLMRYMLYEANANTVALRQEMDYLQDFISLQQLRYDKRPIANFIAVGDLDVYNIAPLLFIHLLENAYKHSPAHLEAGAIQVRIEIKEGSLTFSIQNPLDVSPIKPSTEVGGIGLTNLQKRLQLLYPSKHQLTINRSVGLYTVVLEIHRLPLREHDPKADLLYNR